MICYHHNDLDGKAAAHCVHTYKPKTIPDSPDSYVQCTYDDKFDKHTIKDDVFIVDLSISPATYSAFLEVCKTARTVTWIDHHKSSIEIIAKHKDELQAIKNLTYFVQDCACGAALTYAYFKIPYNELLKIRRTNEDEEYLISAKCKDKEIFVTCSKTNKKDPTDYIWYDTTVHLPIWLSYIDDFDCWKKRYIDTDHFILGCDSCNTAFTIYHKKSENRIFNQFWETIYHKDMINTHIACGTYINKYLDSRHSKELTYTFEWGYEDTTFICKNATGNSWNFKHLITRYPAAIIFFYNGKSGRWQYSVYSDENSTFDCKAFCEKFGGGGHLHAAGFSTDKLIFLHSEAKQPKPIIFLGGTCNGDTWREEFIAEWKKVAKHLPETKNIELFNPVVEDWTKEAQEKENEVKNEACINLFVITPKIKGLFSIAEVIECANNNIGKTIFVVYDKYETGFGGDFMKKSFDAIGELVEKHNGIYATLEGENACSNLVEVVMSNV